MRRPVYSFGNSGILNSYLYPAAVSVISLVRPVYVLHIFMGVICVGARVVIAPKE